MLAIKKEMYIAFLILPFFVMSAYVSHVKVIFLYRFYPGWNGFAMCFILI